MKVKKNVKAGDSVKIIALASFVVLAVAFGAPQNVRAYDVTVGGASGGVVNSASCEPSTGMLSVSIVINHVGTSVVFLAGAYEGYSGQVVTDQRGWIRHDPWDDVVIGYDEISFLYPWSGWWRPFLHLYIWQWDGYQYRWVYSSYWVPFWNGDTWCGM
jgi:hypothetical protein